MRKSKKVLNMLLSKLFQIKTRCFSYLASLVVVVNTKNSETIAVVGQLLKISHFEEIECSGVIFKYQGLYTFEVRTNNLTKKIFGLKLSEKSFRKKVIRVKIKVYQKQLKINGRVFETEIESYSEDFSKDMEKDLEEVKTRILGELHNALEIMFKSDVQLENCINNL